jgi:serine/threonine protein kinase
MAPEQIEGQDADARTDIWAFGEAAGRTLTVIVQLAGQRQSPRQEMTATSGAA